MKYYTAVKMYELLQTQKSLTKVKTFFTVQCDTMYIKF